MKSITPLIATCLTAMTVMACFTGTAWADDHRGTHVVLGQNAGSTSYSATITTSGRGVWINVHARQSYSGQYASPSGATTVYTSYGSGPRASSSGSGTGYNGTARVGRSWTNAWGEPYYEVGGRVYHLAGVNIGWESAGPSGWFTVGSRQHHGTVPEALYVNVTVAVQVEATSYTWNFGDGATLVSHDLGQPYPAESDIKHTYQYSSLHFPDGFPIRLTIQFAASYSVNGGPLTPLSTMTRTYTASYRVQEVQSILTNQ